MANIDQLLQRIKDFAATCEDEEASIIARHPVYVITRLDLQTDPSAFIELEQVPEGPECVSAVRWALERGYRHIDTAEAYRNEASVAVSRCCLGQPTGTGSRRTAASSTLSLRGTQATGLP
jgi:hypothetical protein